MGTDRSSFLVKSIDTEYSGYLFRSRLEARWAVFFDALGIKWEYEPEGFQFADGKRYLPDFWLPNDQAFFEIKSAKDNVTVGEINKARKVQDEVGRRIFIAAGDPVDAYIAKPSDWPHNWGMAKFTVCPVCDMPAINTVFCGCIDKYACDNRYDPRIKTAASIARKMRFEFAKVEKVQRCERKIVNGANVYMAGKVHIGSGGKNEWRELIRQQYKGIGKLPNDVEAFLPWRYVGPNTEVDHNGDSALIVEQCMTEISRADVVFCWIESSDAYGTLAEIGFAYKACPIFIGFSDLALRQEMWFAAKLADQTVTVPSVQAAWRVFENWWNRAT